MIENEITIKTALKLIDVWKQRGKALTDTAAFIKQNKIIAEIKQQKKKKKQKTKKII